MQQLATVLLHHRTRRGSHYDWMLQPPAGWGCGGRLWTARTTWPSRCWRPAGRWRLELIGLHRPAYLGYQGPVSGGRGQVLRVDEGWFIPQLWTASRVVIDLAMRQCRGRIEMRPTAGGGWLAAMVS